MSTRKRKQRRRAQPVRKDRGVRLLKPTAAKPGVWRIVAGTGSTAKERTATTRAEADQIFDQMVTAVAQGVITTTSPRTTERDDSLRGLAQETVEGLRENQRAVRYVDKIEYTLEHYVLPIIGDVAIVRWETRHCRRVIKKARKDGLAPATIQDIGSAMRAMVRHAHAQSPLRMPTTQNPMAAVDYATPRHSENDTTGKAVPERFRPSTETIVATARFLKRRGRETGRPWLHLPGLVMGFAGLRLGEVLALRAGDIDLTQGYIEVRRSAITRNKKGAKNMVGSVKNRRARTTFLPEVVLQDLGKRVSEVLESTGKDGYLFPSPSGDLMRHELWRDIAVKPARKAGVWPADSTWEHHRHHTATWLRDQGCSIEAISKILGHSRPSFTQDRYFMNPSDYLESTRANVADFSIDLDVLDESEVESQ
jgi:integrase